MPIYDDSLAHYGVKGMKWGVRRYQNKDGSYTNAGKHRRRSQNSSDYEETRSLRRKSSKRLSNEELKKLNKRLNLESEYRRLNPRGIFRGQQVARTVIGLAGTIGGLYAISQSPWVESGKEIVENREVILESGKAILKRALGRR